MDYINLLIGFLGGLGMFIYGMHIMANGLENAAGSRLKSILGMLTKNKFLGVCLGAIITAIIQSSSATTVMVVGFVNAGIMNLTQAIGVIMGANVGTTMTGWLVSSSEWSTFLSPTTIAPVIIMVGVVMMLIGKRSTTKDMSNIFIGFGLLFIGIASMSDAVKPLRSSQVFVDMFVELGTSPLLGILAGAVVTAVIQSSSASVGILQSLASAGLVPFSAAVYIIMGQNIGTCVTAMLSGMGAKKNAKTAALMHLLFNVMGTVLFSVAAITYFKVINPAAGVGAISLTEISVVHTIFNIATTVLLYPMSNIIIKMAKKLGKIEEGEQDDSIAHLDDRMLQTPSIALESAVTEITRMGHMICESMDDVSEVLFDRSSKRIENIKEIESKVNNISNAVTDYTVKLGTLQINEKEHEDVSSLITIVTAMRRVSDYCENVSEFAGTMSKHKLEFSEAGAKDLKEMLSLSVASFKLAMETLETKEQETALRVVEKETRADEMEVRLRKKHIKRLAKTECNSGAGIVFLDTLVCLERISDHSRSIAEEIIKNGSR